MAKALGLSPAYVNLLENNQRSVSIQVLMRLSDAYGVDWRDLVDDESATTLADLRGVLQDPIFGAEKPDIQELRAAIDHCPRLAQSMIALHKSYRAMSARLLGAQAGAAGGGGAAIEPSPEAVVHDLFRRNRNHFNRIERAAEQLRAESGADGWEIEAFYVFLKQVLKERFAVAVETATIEAMPHTLRDHDEEAGVLHLSEALDYQNKLFQLSHVVGLLYASDLFDQEITDAGISAPRAQARCRVELANYFAAAVLMPYDRFRAAAARLRYDIDLIAAKFGVSFEQTCHRLTTLQRDGARGVPFFFLRLDKAGNVAKRFNATQFQLAEYGGACPRWDIHLSFRTPGRILTQFVETPDGARYLTINRTVDRPAMGRESHDHRLAVTLGCAIEHAPAIAYADPFQLDDAQSFTPIGINCQLCPRQHCAQRAQQPLHLELPIDERRRGETRFES